MTKKTIDTLPWASKSQKILIHLLITGKIDPDDICRGRYTGHKGYPPNWDKNPFAFRRILEGLDIVCDTYGIEVLQTSAREGIQKSMSYVEFLALQGSDSGEKMLMAEYVNTGDTYTPTIVYRYDTKRHWQIISIGDLVEVYARQGIPIY